MDKTGSRVGESDKKPQGSKQSTEISVDLLMKEIKADPDATNKKYGGQLLTLAGVIEDSNYQGGDGSPRIMLSGPDNSLAGCFFTTKTARSISNLTDGQKVKIRGTASMLTVRFVTMGDCELVEAGPAGGFDFRL